MDYRRMMIGWVYPIRFVLVGERWRCYADGQSIFVR